jgi:hypothetical protein
LIERQIDVNFDVTQSRFAIFFAHGLTIEETNGSNGNDANVSDSLLADGEHQLAVDNRETLKPSRQVTFDILANGEVSIAGQNVVKTEIIKEKESLGETLQDHSKAKSEHVSLSLAKLQTLVRSLEITTDIDVWVSWLEKSSGE